MMLAVEMAEVRADKGATAPQLSKWTMCPITNKRLNHPVLLSDGFSYEKDAVYERLSRQPNLSPSTGGPLRTPHLFPNHALQAALRAQAGDPTSQWWLGLTCMQRSGEVMTQPVVLSDGHSYDASEVSALLCDDRQLISRRAGGKAFATLERPIPNRALQAMIAEVHGIACPGYTKTNQSVSPAFYGATSAAAGFCGFVALLEGVVGGVVGGILGGPKGEYDEPTPSAFLGVLLGVVVPAAVMSAGAIVGGVLDKRHWQQEVERTRLLRPSSEEVKRPSLLACINNLEVTRRHEPV